MTAMTGLRMGGDCVGLWELVFHYVCWLRVCGHGLMLLCNILLVGECITGYMA